MLKTILTVLSIVVLGAGVFWVVNLPKSEPDSIVSQLSALPDHSLTFLELGGTVFQVEVVNTSASIVKGLSERDKIGSDGMLFVFKHPDIHKFWMLDMQFELDIIWIADEKVVGFELNTTKPQDDSKELQIYQPGQVVDLVLEVNAGFVDQHQIKIGDELLLLQP